MRLSHTFKCTFKCPRPLALCVLRARHAHDVFCPHGTRAVTGTSLIGQRLHVLHKNTQALPSGLESRTHMARPSPALGALRLARTQRATRLPFAAPSALRASVSTHRTSIPHPSGTHSKDSRPSHTPSWTPAQGAHTQPAAQPRERQLPHDHRTPARTACAPGPHARKLGSGSPSGTSTRT